VVIFSARYQQKIMGLRNRRTGETPISTPSLRSLAQDRLRPSTIMRG
jgi:hypothetical protein